MKRNDREKALGIALLVLIVALALATTLIAPPQDGVDGSVTAKDDEGRRKLFLLFGELGLEPRVWNQLPGKLPRGEHVLWLAQTPEPWLAGDADDDDEDEGEDEDAAPQPSVPAAHDPIAVGPAGLDLHALEHYGRFVEEGGALVLAHDARSTRFLVDVLGFAEIEGLAIDERASGGLLRVRTQAGEEFDAVWPAGARFAGLPPDADARIVWSVVPDDAQGEVPLAISVPLGSGEIVLLADDALFDNAALADEDHALLAVRLAESLGRGGELLFDEYALGLWQPQTLTDLVLSPVLFLASVHLVALCALFVLRSAWARQFPRDPLPLAQVSPLSRARALAHLVERARRFDLLAHMLRRGVLRELRAEPEGGRPVARDARDVLSTQELENALDALERRAVGPAARARWRTALTRPIADAAALDALGGELAALAAEAAAAAARGRTPTRLEPAPHAVG